MAVTVSMDGIGIQCRCDQPLTLLERRVVLDSREQGCSVLYSLRAAFGIPQP